MTRTLPTPRPGTRAITYPNQQTPNAFDIHTAQKAKISTATAKYAVEAIGTFFLVLTIGGAVHSTSPLAPLAIGAVLMAMIYAGGHLSGAHYNPAVTLAVLVRGRIGLREAVGYCSAQLAGALVAAAIVAASMPRNPAGPLQVSGVGAVAAVIAETLFTFALCYVVLNVATSKDHPDNSFYGLAIGFTVMAGAVAVGAISGGAFNPAVVVAGIATGQFSGSLLWLYVPAQILAGLAAGAAFRTLNPADK